MEGGSEIDFDTHGASPKCVKVDLKTHPALGDSCIPYLRYFPTTFPPGQPSRINESWAEMCSRT